MKDDSPASDLHVLLSSAESGLTITLLPNGKEYCLEDAEVQSQMDVCAGDLEDALWMANRDKERVLEGLRVNVKLIELSRNPCGFFERLFRGKRCKIGD